MEPKWDLFSVILYCIMGSVGYFCSSKALRCKYNGRSKIYYYALWFSIWVLFASLRYVTYRIGGTDARTYVYFFENINSPYLPSYYEHYDQGFWIFTWIIRLFTSNYHIYFMVFYGVLVYCYIRFVDEFSVAYGIYTSYFLIFFIYLRGFASFRTNLSVAFLLLSLVYLHRNQKIKMIAYIIIACSMHKATLLYALFYVFYYINKKKPITIKASAVFSVLAGLTGYIVRDYIGLFFDSEIYAYASYATRSIGASFFDNFWKIAIGQLILMVMMIILNKDIIKIIETDKKNKGMLSLLRTLCIYDFVTIPITFILGVWRGYEYFYLPRMAMWGIIIYIETYKFFNYQYKKMYRIITYIAMVVWFIFRLYNTYEESSLLPYIFAPLM